MEKHKALVMGIVEKKRYYCSRGDNYGYIPRYATGSIKVRGEFLEHKEIWSGELENPPLNRDEYLYITDMNKKVLVRDKAKSTEGGYIYWTDHVDYIEDEETEKSRLQAEENQLKLEKYIEELKLKEESAAQKDKEVDVQHKAIKNWWQFWK
jgi:hypothetical protein